MTEEKITIVGRVLKKSKELLQYENKNGSTMRYFNIIIGNGEEITHIRCYQKHKFQMVREGLTYRFANAIRKADVIWIIQSSTIGIVGPVACSLNDIPMLPEDEPAIGQKRSLSQALGSPQKSTVCAKIAKVSPVSLRCEGTLPVRCLGLVDGSHKTKVALFKDLAEQEYTENTVVELSGLYRKTYNGKDQLVASTLTKCQFLSNDHLPIDVSEEDKQHFTEDTDFGCQENKVDVEDLHVIAICDVHIYQACDYDGCYKKKLQKGVCPTCSGTSAKLTCRIKIEVEKQNHATIESVIFENDAKLIFGNFPLESDDNMSLMADLAEKLPLQFKACLRNNKLFNISK